MGYVAHDVVIVHTWREGAADEADNWREKFINLFKVFDDGSPVYDMVAVRFGGDYGYEVGASITYVQPDPS